MLLQLLIFMVNAVAATGIIPWMTKDKCPAATKFSDRGGLA